MAENQELCLYPGKFIQIKSKKKAERHNLLAVLFPYRETSKIKSEYTLREEKYRFLFDYHGKKQGLSVDISQEKPFEFIK